MTTACKHEYRELARTTQGQVGILLGCTHCPATVTDWPGRKKKR